MRGISNLFQRKLIKNPNTSIPRTFMEGLAKNGMSVQKGNDPLSKTIYIDINVIESVTPLGGIVVFPAEINKVKIIQPTEDDLNVFVLQKLKSLSSNIIERNKVKHFFKKSENSIGFGYTLGAFINGKFQTIKEEITFESGISKCIEIIGIENERLIIMAEDICSHFKINCVMLNIYDPKKNVYSNNLYLIKNRDMV